MLAASALRLAAVDALCPTVALRSDSVFPTMAEHRVFDNRPIGVDDLDPEGPWTPCLTVQTEDVRAVRLGPTSGPQAHPSVVLVVIAELAVSDTDDDGVFADASASTDPTARLVLDALCAQVRKVLQHSPAGSPFRAIGFVTDVTIEPFSLPQYGVRWLRNFMRFTCQVKDDHFTDEAGLPEPCASLRRRLHPESYARGKLDELDCLFAATSRDALEAITITTQDDLGTAPDASA